MPYTDSEPVAVTPDEATRAHYYRRDLLDALCGCSSPWHDLDSEGIPATASRAELEHDKAGRV